MHSRQPIIEVDDELLIKDEDPENGKLWIYDEYSKHVLSLKSNLLSTGTDR